MKQKVFAALLCCSLIALSGCGVQEAQAFYGERVTLTGMMPDTAYIQDYSIMDCCTEYNEIKELMVRTNNIGLFEIYEFDGFDKSGNLLSYSEPVAVEWQLCAQMLGANKQLFHVTENDLVPVDYELVDTKVNFTGVPGEIYVLISRDPLFQVPTCAVSVCDSTCKSCS